MDEQRGIHFPSDAFSVGEGKDSIIPASFVVVLAVLVVRGDGQRLITRGAFMVFDSCTVLHRLSAFF